MQQRASYEVLTTINFWDPENKMRHKDQNHFHSWRLKFLRSWETFEFQDWKMRSRDHFQIFNLCFKKFLKIKIFEIQRKKWIFQSITKKIYIEEKNDIQNPKAKLSTNKNHSHLVNVRQVSPPYHLAPLGCGSQAPLVSLSLLSLTSWIQYTPRAHIVQALDWKIFKLFSAKPFW